jgi:hypothetical protein
MELSHGTFRIEVDDILAKGDRVIVFCTESAQRGGRSWSSPQVHVWTVKDGRATVFWQYRAISRPKTSSGRRRSNQKVGRSLRPEHFRPWGNTVDVCGSWQCSQRAFARCRTVPQRRHQVALDWGATSAPWPASDR